MQGEEIDVFTAVPWVRTVFMPPHASCLFGVVFHSFCTGVYSQPFLLRKKILCEKLLAEETWHVLAMSTNINMFRDFSVN